MSTCSPPSPSSPLRSQAVASRPRNRTRLALGAINVLGGVAVLASYTQGLATGPANREAIWGGIPDELRGFYTVSMLLAAAGYLLLSHYAYFHLAVQRARVYGIPAVRLLLPLYFAVLVPSALWLPLTLQMLSAPTAPFWSLVCLNLAVVAIASLGLLFVVAAAEPRGSRAAHRLAVLGGVAFCFQTAVLDAVVWTFSFPA